MLDAFDSYKNRTNQTLVHYNGAMQGITQTKSPKKSI